MTWILIYLLVSGTLSLYFIFWGIPTHLLGLWIETACPGHHRDWNVHAHLLQSCWPFATLWTVAHQAPLSMRISRQESWSGLPCPPLEDFPNPRIEPWSPALQSNSLPLSQSHEGSPLLSCIPPIMSLLGAQLHLRQSWQNYAFMAHFLMSHEKVASL